jgi:RNA binding exosome subunit|tara:strand:+ start:16290 stop:16532 length:243 start_codon:yes stop_codon:yes gene_type:complete
MDKQDRLITALQYIHSVDKLIIDEDYQGYMGNKLLMVEIEIQRQLQLITNERRRFSSSNQQYTDDAKQQRSKLSNLASTD